jgi:hypothetical protein
MKQNFTVIENYGNTNMPTTPMRSASGAFGRIEFTNYSLFIQAYHVAMPAYRVWLCATAVRTSRQVRRVCHQT